MMNLYKSILDDLIRNGICYSETFHSPVFTAKEANQISGTKFGNGLKSIALEVSSEIVVFTMRDDEKIVFSKLKEFFSVKTSFLKPDLIQSMLGSELGGLAPFGYPKNIKCFISKSAKELKCFEINPGVNHKTIKLNRDDFLLLLNFYKVESIPNKILIKTK